MFAQSMFDGSLIHWTAVDLEKDVADAAVWTTEMDVARQLRGDALTRPMADFEVKKVFEDWMKKAEDTGQSFIYAIRERKNERLVGVFHLAQILWVHGAGKFDLVMGSEEDRAVFGGEALQMAVRYSFAELNLFRISAHVPEYDHQMAGLFEQERFTLEVRQRQAVYWSGRYWDSLSYGMLRPEWMMYQKQAEVAA